MVSEFVLCRDAIHAPVALQNIQPYLSFVTIMIHTTVQAIALYVST